MNTLKLIAKFIKKNIFLLIITIVLMIFLNYIRSLIPKLTSEFIYILDQQGDSTLPKILQYFYKDSASIKNSLLITAILIIVICAFRELINIIVDIFVYRISEDVGCAAQIAYFKKLQNLPYTYLNRAKTGDLIQRATSDIGKIKTFISGSLLELFNSLCRLVIFSLAMIFINVKFSLIVFTVLPIYFLTSYFYFKIQSKDFEKLEEQEGKMESVLQENLTAIRVVKSFANEKQEINKFNNSIDEYTSTWKKVVTRMSFFWGSSDFITYLQLILVFGLSVYFVYNNLMTFSQVAAMFLYTQSIAWPCRNLGRELAELGKTSIACGRILEIVNLNDEYDNLPPQIKPSLDGDIVFENVSLQFSDANIATLHDINIKIKKGETIAIIGKTGAGKSTFVNMINRLIEPTSGKITINGYDIRTIDKAYLRENVGVVLQDPFLFSGTIEENINIANSMSDVSKAKELAYIASVDEDIDKFDLKYQTVVGERGITLSGGQKQRIAIARMLSNNKKILIFDDSLSAVDTETDMKIRSALKKVEQECTTIIITHRITTAKDADKIVVFENGTITEVGTHDELINKEGLYKTIWDIQNYFVSPQAKKVSQNG